MQYEALRYSCTIHMKRCILSERRIGVGWGWGCGWGWRDGVYTYNFKMGCEVKVGGGCERNEKGGKRRKGFSSEKGRRRKRNTTEKSKQSKLKKEEWSETDLWGESGHWGGFECGGAFIGGYRTKIFRGTLQKSKLDTAKALCICIYREIIEKNVNTVVKQ